MPLREVDLRRVRVSAVMTRSPATVEEQASLADAAAEMVGGGFRHLPVVNGSGRIVGMISERDLRARLGTEVAGFADVAADALSDRVADAMTPDPITLPPTATLAEALEVFADDRVGAVPIVDVAERLVGILSYVDLLGAIRELAEPARVRERPRESVARESPRKRPRRVATGRPKVRSRARTHRR